MANLSRQHGRKIIGFDSFSGFPKISESDKSHRKAQLGEWSVRTLNEAREFIASLGYQSFAEVHKMVFDSRAINPIPNVPIAVLHIDLDLYEGYDSALNLFWSQVSTGGIVILDEFGTAAWPGATKAVNEFVARHNLTVEEYKNSTGIVKHFISKRQ